MSLIENILKEYVKQLTITTQKGDAREESYYKALADLINKLAQEFGRSQIDVTVLPKKTEAGNPDFRVWDGRQHIVGYIEAKKPQTNLDQIEASEQLKRYLSTFPNLILTDFYEFRLYRDGVLIDSVLLARPVITDKLGKIPPLQKVDEFVKLWQKFFDFILPKTYTAQSLAVELAKRTRFLRDLVYSEEIEAGKDSAIIGFYEAFRDNLIKSLTERQFADLYAQTITYGLFAARTRAEGEFNRMLAFKYIPKSIGILRDVFKFISLEEPSKQMQVIIDDIAEVLFVADIQKILHEYDSKGKGSDPIVHFYETFLAEYDPEIRERRGVYYTPEPVVLYIVRAINEILKTHFNFSEGLANEGVKLLDPAAGTLTFPAEAIRKAVDEHAAKWGKGDLNNWIRRHILQNFYAFELMMAPYAIGHLKIGFILEELGLRLTEDERFRLYLTNTLELEPIEQQQIPILRSLSAESIAAAQVKKQDDILVILGNPPYSGISANINEWTERLLKENSVDGVEIQSYYEVDGKPLGEKKLWLQDDYVKFLRFAQWKIAQAGFGIVGMITNHSYLDNPTFRGMRQSLMKTFDQIYILNLHGNSLKKEVAPDGGKDENVFDIRQGVAIALFVKLKQPTGKCRVFYYNLYGLREEKYSWLGQNIFTQELYEEIKPASPYYFFVPIDINNIKHFLKWIRIDQIYTVYSTGVLTARDKLAIDFDKNKLLQKLKLFGNPDLPDDIIRKTFNLKDTKTWKLKSARENFRKIKNFEKAIRTILYRPFDTRFIWYYNTKTMIEGLRWDTMRHMIGGKNIALIVPKRVETKVPWQHCLLGNTLIDHVAVSLKTVDYVFPLYLYPDLEKKDLFSEENKNKQREPNLNKELVKRLTQVYGTEPTPEQILYYIYAVFYSNIYRERYAEFLKIDFPRVPFTSDYDLFLKLAELGQELAELHLMKSDLLNEPIARFEGEGENMTVEKIRYDEKNQRVYINKDKYFTGIYPELWNYYIGCYQVLSKLLKDRKGRELAGPQYYIKIATALHHTIRLQKEIDQLYPEVGEKQLD